MCSREKCMRKGPVTRNGYLNFLREFRKKECGLSQTESIRCGAKAWNRLSCDEKAKYSSMGCKARKPRKKRSCRPKRKRRSCRPKRRRPKCPRRRKRRPSCGKRKRCMKPGPLTNNPYLNFLRAYRRKHCRMKPNEAIERGARRWCAMSKEQRARYMRQACKMSKSKRRQQTPICRAMRNKRKC